MQPANLWRIAARKRSGTLKHGQRPINGINAFDILGQGTGDIAGPTPHVEYGTRLVSDQGVPLIADFGSARLSEYNPATDLMGTARWMSRELLKKTKFTTESDIWATGITFFVSADETGNSGFLDVFLSQGNAHKSHPIRGASQRRERYHLRPSNGRWS